MKEFFGFIKKPTDILEIYSIVKYYKIKNVTLYVKKCPWASETEIKNYAVKKLKKITEIISFLKDKNFKNSDVYWLKILKKFKIVALPFHQFKSFYLNLNNLKANKTKVILISDGIVDNLELYKFILANNSLLSILSIRNLKYFFLANKKVDECFFTLYPLKNNFSKFTKPVSSSFLPETKIINLLRKSKIKNLIIGGKGLVANDFIKRYKIKNYCYTIRKDTNKNSTLRYLIINGKKIELKNILLAEELINTKLIKKVYSYLNTSAFYAIQRKIDVKIIYKRFNPFFLYFFLKENFKRLSKKPS
ncbi:hypothetical protein [Candidatus Pelagibacter communis]|uniref:hypothetical protein n=1 Tax=Pelagibacter ubique TaxID=198252 RepID=UPI000B7E6B2A|nr:hypothetical protein [Candidatus Pelagibacter ubique]